ncbi:methionyl-tRNA formyltransferase [Glaciecola sp. XM2]|uniref:methionyl-tRNA formyltransferase n=1 Tax=Glaciecola sp. XM2 TaxID=1914931 RepID=UPI001BDEC9B6|nr:methionyl-tRNA formyltransferase [Glaciecola sp. XM2]
MRIIFAGTPDFAAAHLQALLSVNPSQFEIIAVYTQPDRPAGRGKKLTPSAVKTLALEHNLPVEQPQSLKTKDAQAVLDSYQGDIMVVVAYGLILPKAVLDTPRLGCINVHGSLLPKWRGAAPIQRAVWAGDMHTGVSIMQMDEGLDTGDVLLEKTLAIEPEDTSASVYQKLAQLGPLALVETLEQFDNLTAKPQMDDDATYAHKLSKAEAKCDWQLSAAQLERNVRAFNPWPVAWFEHHNAPVKIWRAQAILNNHDCALGSVIKYDQQGLDIAVKDGILRLKQLQLAGKKPQAITELINGKPDLFSPGEQL